MKTRPECKDQKQYENSNIKTKTKFSLKPVLSYKTAVSEAQTSSLVIKLR